MQEVAREGAAALRDQAQAGARLISLLEMSTMREPMYGTVLPPSPIPQHSTLARRAVCAQ